MTVQMSRLLLAALAALLLAPPGAWAAGGPAPDPAPDRVGFHVGVGAVYAFQDIRYDVNSLDVEKAYPSNFDPHFDDSAGIELSVGYRLHPRLDVMLQYEWLEGFDSTRGNPALELDTHRLLCSARVFLATGRWQPYVMVGAGALIVNTEIVNKRYNKPYDVDVGAAFRFGGGLDFYATPHWVVGVEGGYVVPTGPVSPARYGNLDAVLRYRF